MTERSHQRSLAGFDDEPADVPRKNEDLKPVVQNTKSERSAETAEEREMPQCASEASDSAAGGPVDLKGKTIYVVDSFSLIFQVFHAIPEMSSPDGQPVGAVFGFVRDILYLLEQKKPDYLVCAFDLPGPTFRNELYDQYKANRDEMPESLRPQIPNIRRVLEAFDIPILDHEGFEADDVLATIARLASEQEAHVFLVTSDKDCRQLINDYVSMYNVRKDELFDADSLMKVWGIRPDQVVDFQSLVGDKVDNVPGVPLIGPKIACELLGRFGSLENVLDRADEVSQKKRRQNLIEGRDAAMMSRDLVRLENNVPLELDWTAWQNRKADTAQLGDLFQQFGFRSFLGRVESLSESPKPAQVWEADYHTITTADELQALADELAQQPRISLDTETTHTNPRWAQIVGYSFAFKPGIAYYIPVLAPEGEPRIDPLEAADILRPVLENAQIGKIGQNLKYDMIVLRGAGIRLAGNLFDTMVADYLLDPGSRSHGLNDLSQRLLGHTPIPISDLIGKGKNQRRMDEVALAEIGPYAAEDADVPIRLVPLLESGLKDDNLEGLLADLEMPLIEVLVELEYNGIRIDVEHLSKLSTEFGGRMEELQGEIHALAGHEFNIASPKQLAHVLFDELKLPVIKKTAKSGPSTDAEVLESLSKSHDIAAKIIDYRQYAKLKGTYVDALPELVCSSTGRVHTSFNQVVAATGRLSSRDPNLQNIPVRTLAGQEIRAAFVPEGEGWQLLAADYSQVELRVLAHYSQDVTLLEAFRQDEDIHARVASEVHGVPLDQVTSEMRRGAKAINFGVMYGQSPYGLAKGLNIEQSEAAAFIDAYFERYDGVDRLMEEILDQCHKDGYVSTLLGRRRAIQGVRDRQTRQQKQRQRTLPERTAINTVIQGTAADIIKRAMIDVLQSLRESPLHARMLLQIHDELVFETPPEEIEALTKLVRDGMSAAAKLAVPLKVDVKAGPNWAACEPLA